MDKYYSRPKYTEHYEALPFRDWQSNSIEASATPVYSTLRQKGHLNVGYIDDSYLQGKDTNECLLNISDTQTLFTRLGFVINAEIIRHSRPANYIFSLCPCCVNDN